MCDFEVPAESGTFMLEMIVTCAGCGKRFKGIPSAKKFKCSCCGNLFTFPDSARAPSEGSVLCSCCWTGHQKAEDLEHCSACNQEILFDGGGTAEWSTEIAARPASVSGSFQNIAAPEALLALQRERDELARENADLKLRMLTLQENQAQMAQERDLASAAHQSFEERIIELKTRLQLAADAQREAESKLLELQARHVSLQDNETNALREMDGAALARQALEMRVAELDAQLKALKEVHEHYVKDRDAALESNRLSENRVVELLTRADTSREAQQATAKERDAALSSLRELESRAAMLDARFRPVQEELEKIRADLQSATRERDTALASARELESRAAMLDARLRPAQEEVETIRAERDDLISRRNSLETRLSEMQDRMAALQETAAGARAERDHAQSTLDDERSRRVASQTRLKQSQDLATTALGPLGNEYVKISRELSEQAEAIFRLAAQTQEELDARRSQLAMIERTLRHRLDGTCREFVEKLAQETDAAGAPSVLAQPPVISDLPSDNVVMIPAPNKPSSDSKMIAVADSGEHASVAGQ